MTDAFIAKAKEQGFTDDEINEYLSKKDPATVSAQAAAPQADAFATKAREQGFSEEEIAAYQAKKNEATSVPVEQTVENAEFAKPSLSLPFAVKPFYRDAYTDDKGNFHNPMEDYTSSTILGRKFIGSDKPENQAEFESRIRDSLSDEVVRNIASQIGADPTTQSGIDAVYSHAQREAEWRTDARKAVANLQELVNVDRPFTWISKHFSNDAAAEYTSIQMQSDELIAKLAAERGIDLVKDRDGRYSAYDEAGNLHPVTPTMLESMGKAKYEAIGGLSGALAASRLPISHPLGRLGATAVGGLIGTLAGEELDYLSAAIEAREELDARVAVEKALGAANTAALFETVGGVAGMAFKAVSKPIIGAYNMIKDGNTAGAYSALKDTLGYLSDDEIEDLVYRWEKINQQEAPGGSIQEKAMAVLPTTSPGGELIVEAAARADSRVSSVIKADLNQRAQSVLAAAKNPAENTGKVLLKAIGDYTNEVKTSYGIVKDLGSQVAPEGYRFNLPNVATRPALEAAMESITDPALVERLVRTLDKIESLTKSRTFEDLLELRATLNDFRFNTRFKGTSGFNAKGAVEESIAEVDSEIARVMDTPDGKLWLEDWKDVNKEYAKYQQLKTNNLFKAVVKSGISENDIARSLVKYGASIDGTYTDVINKLPIKTKALVENEIMDILANRAALGKGEEFTAISFPELAKELSAYKFTSAKATQLKTAVNQLAEVYKNDRELFKINANLKDPAGQTIATSLRSKAKMAFVNAVWKRITRTRGTAQADIGALIDKSAKFLENPLDGKAADKVIKDIADDEELAAALKRLQVEAAKDPAGTARVVVYKDSAGRTYYKPGNRRNKVDSLAMPMHRVVKAEFAQEAIGKEITSKAALTKLDRKKLLDSGYIAIALDNGQLLDLR